MRNGRIEAVGTSVKIPAGAQRIDLAGKTIIPGLINGHGHVSNLDQLGLYARYGVTTVLSLGGDKEIELRDQTRAEQQTPALMRSRLFIAGPIPTSKTAEEARKAVDAIAAAKTDIVKIRLDDNLGRGAKMPVEAYTAILDEAHKKGMRVAVHVVTLADGEGRAAARRRLHRAQRPRRGGRRRVHRADEEERRVLLPDVPARALHVRRTARSRRS